LFQNGALLNSLTVAENIAIPLEQHTNLPLEIIHRLIYMKLKLVGLEHASDMLPSQLSGGMRKRAALARALALDPALLFCDEPSAGLDPVTLDALDNLILKLKTQLGMTIILVTHEVSSIFRLADRIVFLEQGEVIYIGNLTDAVKSDNPSVSDFFSKAKGKVS
jgi:phospholipid/cholesterol/gamma-HCH transport system ATP-binding protein